VLPFLICRGGLLVNSTEMQQTIIDVTIYQDLQVRSSRNFCACYLWPWLLAALRYVMYFRLCGWHYFFYNGTYWCCQSVSALCSRSRGSYICRLLERLPRTSQTTVAFCRTLVVAHCGPTPVTCGSCSCRELITNSVMGVSRPPVLDCGTTFHLDYGGRDLPSTPSDNL